MPGSGVTPELVALIPSGYTPLTWAKAGETSMQMVANTQSGVEVGLAKPHFTRRAEPHRLRIVPAIEASTRCYSGLLWADSVSPDSGLTALARAAQQSQPQ